jgi:hypothetical protein
MWPCVAFPVSILPLLDVDRLLPAASTAASVLASASNFQAADGVHF